MEPLTRSVCSLLLLALLLAVAACPAQAGEPFGSPCSSPWRGLLDCRHAGLATVPPATSARPLDMLDFTDNALSTLGPQTWKGYQWTETLILKDNKLRAVKSHSLEGLFLLKHLDLSGNAIKSIEERAFEPLPFLEHLNLSGNRLTQIPSGAFEAWHGMQFLRELILSQNPLTVIADTAFFKLPSVNYLDLSATQVSAETLLLFLQTASHLETLKVPRALSCCLCKERGAIETPCRTIQFLCENLCSTSTAQCGSLSQTRAELMAAAQSGQLRSSSVLYLTAKEVSPAHHGSVTFAVSGKQDSTEGDLSSQGDPRADWHSSPHLSSQDSKAIDELLVMLQDAQKTGGTGAMGSNPSVLAERLVAELQSQQPDAQSPLAVAKVVPQQPPPARRNVQKFPAVEEKKTTGWEQKQLESGLNLPVFSLWDVDGGSKHLEEKQLESGLNWPILNLWDVAGVSNGPNNSAAFGHQGAKEAAGPQRSSVRVYQRRQRDTSSQLRHNPISYQGPGNVRGEEEPRPRESQGLDREPENFFDLWLKSHPEDSAEEEGSFVGQYWKPAEARVRLSQEGGGSQSPGRVSAPAELTEPKAEHHLRSRAPNEALQTFITHVTGALRAECSQPGLQLPCARMLSKTGLLAKRLNLRQDRQGAPALTEQCLPLALQTGKEPAGKKNAGLNHPRVTGILVFVFIMIFSIVFVLIVMVLYLMQAHCWVWPEEVWQDTVKPSLRRLLEKLRWGEIRTMLSCAFGGEGGEWARNVCQACPSPVCASAGENLSYAGALAQHAGEFRWFEAQTILLMEEDARVLRLYNWHRQRREYLAAAEAKDNNAGQQDE